MFNLGAGELWALEVGTNGAVEVKCELQEKQPGAFDVFACDFCGCRLGRMDEIEYVFSPESVLRAAKGGFVPKALLDAETKVRIECPEGVDEFIKTSRGIWKATSEMSQTEWAACKNCNKELNLVLGNKNTRRNIMEDEFCECKNPDMTVRYYYKGDVKILQDDPTALVPYVFEADQNPDKAEKVTLCDYCKKHISAEKELNLVLGNKNTV